MAVGKRGGCVSMKLKNSIFIIANRADFEIKKCSKVLKSNSFFISEYFMSAQNGILKRFLFNENNFKKTYSNNFSTGIKGYR